MQQGTWRPLWQPLVAAELLRVLLVAVLCGLPAAAAENNTMYVLSSLLAFVMSAHSADTYDLWRNVRLVAVGPAGELYFVRGGQHCVELADNPLTSNTTRVYAGLCPVAGSAGDNGPATAAVFDFTPAFANALAVDSDGKCVRGRGGAGGGAGAGADCFQVLLSCWQKAIKRHAARNVEAPVAAAGGG